MIVRTIGLVLIAAAALTPAVAQDAPKPITSPACPQEAAQAAAKPGGKVSVKDMTGPMADAARSGSGGGTGKVSMQDMHRTANAGAGTAPVQGPANCPSPKP